MGGNLPMQGSTLESGSLPQYKLLHGSPVFSCEPCEVNATRQSIPAHMHSVRCVLGYDPFEQNKHFLPERIEEGQPDGR